MGQGAALAAAAAFATPRASVAKNSANSRIQVGVIGCGGRGNSHLLTLRALREQDDSVEVVAVNDVYRPRLDAAARRFGAEGAYMDYRELLADPKVEMVSIATPDRLHPQQVMDAVRAGKPVFCEKPISHWAQFEATKEMTRVVRESKVPFQLGTQGLSDPAWHMMRDLVADGIIGKPIHAECGYFRIGDWGEAGMPIDDPEAQPGPDLDWEAFLHDAPKVPFDVSRFFRWRMYMDYAGGPVSDLYPHSLSPVMMILGLGMPDHAVATGGIYRYEEREVPDTFNMIVEFPDDVSVAILGTQGNDHLATGGRGAGSRVPFIRGWEGSLTVEGDDVVYLPPEYTREPAKRFPLEGAQERTINHFRNLIECIHENRTDTWAPIDLTYATQTALIMGMKAWQEGKTARYDAEKDTIT